jgi:hypothetical protein
MLVGLVPLLGIQSCGRTDKEPLALEAALAGPADTIQCTTALDRATGDPDATGLIVYFTVHVDSAADYSVEGQLYQDRRRGPVSFSNRRGEDMSRSALANGSPILARAQRPGPLELTLWFPGSEIHRRAHRGVAWFDVQVQANDTTAQLPRNQAELLARSPHWYRFRIDQLNPANFIERLPGQDIPPPLPEPVPRQVEQELRRRLHR